MKNPKLIFCGLMHSLGVFVYTSAVAWFMFNGERMFGKADSFWMPLALLLLFVLSATIVGSLVLGRPILLYLGGQKPAALKLLFYTVGWLFVIIVIVFLVLLI